MFQLPPGRRRLVYVVIFEITAITLSTFLLMWLSGSGASQSLPLAIAVSAIAVSWNYLYNTLFEAWERRRRIAARTVKIRTLHALGFEAGLLVATVPLYMVWYSVGVLAAIQMELALIAFFLVYTYLFTWGFDTVFALPRYDADGDGAAPAK
ncbi:PACE efflux transporter [Paracoccus aminophilus]|uniref:Chlorhexidine efflux transporter domain-containing protein n=1 Tax=Paracoccus aminophilus JCM 7686 TaxID=1367847 RepID=S5YEZ5_PARAH|nr:PACE efflux transporter [Paracoccus aminophilus]AGT10038.1 hypothetical protein JCM7686_3002 [Paracoccus aminophilus JCM 7686]